jgi:diacylglycerol kinase family enzyme
MKFHNIIVLYNPFSGRFSFKKLNFIKYYLNSLNIKTTILNITEKEFYDKLNNSHNDFLLHYDAVFLAGGDGSLNHIINKLVFTDVPIAHVPMGTVNLFALENKTPFNIKKALDDIINKYEPKKINLGKINDRFFLIMAGVGFDAYVVKEFENKLHKTNEKSKISKKNNIFKYINYIGSVITTLKKYEFIDLKVNILYNDNKLTNLTEYAVSSKNNAANNKQDFIDRAESDFEKCSIKNLSATKNLSEKNIIAKQVIASNLKYYGGPFKVFPNSSCFDDNINVRLIKNINNSFNALLCMVKSIMLSKQYIKNSEFFMKAKKITINASVPAKNSMVYCQCDGEFFGTLPVEIIKVCNAVTLLISPDGEIML